MNWHLNGLIMMGFGVVFILLGLLGIWLGYWLAYGGPR